MTPKSIKEEKLRLRSEMRQNRREIPADQAAAWNSRIAKEFCSWPAYQYSRTVLFYLAMPDEVQTDFIIQDALAQGKTVCVPLLGEKYGEMTAVEITSLDELVVGKFGLKMPNPEKVRIVHPALIDLVVVPAVAFDRAGERLGLGAGYYDRFLPQAGSAVMVGLAWECQLTAAIPSEPHDVRMHYLLTEEGLISCRPETAGS